MTDAPEWALSVPSTDLIHQRPPQEVTRPLPQQQLLEIGREIIEAFLRKVVEAVVGVFVPGSPSFEQLEDWAENLAEQLEDIPIIGPIVELLADLFGIDIGEPGSPDIGEIWANVPIIGDIVEAITGIIDGDLSDLTAWAQDIPILGDIVEAITGVVGGVLDLDNFFTDLLALLGDPLGLGSGSTSFDVDDIPILGPILELFGGASSESQADNFITNLLSLFDSPTGMTTDPGSFDPITAGVQIIGDLIPDLTSGFAGIYNNWFGGTSAAGTPAEVATTVAAIRAAVAGGFTLQTFTASNPAWTVPPELKNATEAYAGAIGGGGRGAAGTAAKTQDPGTVSGGAGGSSGGYKVEKFDPSTLGTTLAIAIGVAASTPGANGGITSIGSLVASNPNSSGISTPQGYQASTSLPGRGGRGGNGYPEASAESGQPGESSATGVGGSGGAGSYKNWAGAGAANASPGTAGAAGQTNNTPISGGAGGGGGGAAVQSWGSASATAGNGGNGGYPGGGSGGGGAAVTTGGILVTPTSGQPGMPANGFAFLLWK